MTKTTYLQLCIWAVFVTTAVLIAFGAKVAFHNVSPWILFWVFVAGAGLAAVALARSRP